jgi:hypothetical protein
MATLALSIGLGRPALTSLTGRYTTLAVPLLCGIYFAWLINGRPLARNWVPGILFFYAILMLLPNFAHGISQGRYHKYFLSKLERDLSSGVPRYILASRSSPILWGNTVAVHAALARLHRAGIRQFRSLREDPAFREVPLPVAPDALHRMTWEGGEARATGPKPGLVFTLPRTMLIGAIRFKYSHDIRAVNPPEPFLISWRGDDRRDFTEARSHLSQMPIGALCAGTREETSMVWIGDPVRQFRISPAPHPGERPSPFRISEIVALVPDDGRSDVPPGGDDVFGVEFRSPYAYAYVDHYSWPIRYRDILRSFFNDVSHGIPRPSSTGEKAR